jgi:GGDEF domain-containing protein
MTQQGEEVLKEFVRRVNALLDRLQKVARLEEGAMNQADLDVLAVASLELLTNTLANMPEPMRSDRLKAFSETLAADIAKKRERIEQSIRKGSA